MKRFSRRAALPSAAGGALRSCAHVLERLERRVLLDANDPVLVLVEQIQELGDIHTIPDVAPYLWQSASETLWDPYDWQNAPWDNQDQDGNGYPDDAYGWNFATNSPNFIDPYAGHGRFVTLGAVNVLNSAGTQASRVKIMYVIGGGLTVNSSGVASAALQYILDKKLEEA